MEGALDGSYVGRDEALSALVREARRGDREAFRRLVEPELAVALGAARILAGSDADGSDAVQDALLSAWRGLDSLRDPVAFPAWFRRHVVRAAMRVSARRPRVTELAVDVAGPSDDLDRAVDQRTLARAFARLDPKDRLVLTLHHYLDLPVAETALHLGVPAGTVKSRVHHALVRLRAAFDAEERS